MLLESKKELIWKNDFLQCQGAYLPAGYDPEGLEWLQTRRLCAWPFIEAILNQYKNNPVLCEWTDWVEGEDNGNSAIFVTLETGLWFCLEFIGSLPRNTEQRIEFYFFRASRFQSMPGQKKRIYRGFASPEVFSFLLFNYENIGEWIRC